LHFRAPQLGAGRGDRREGLAGVVVDELRVNVLVGAEDREARTPGVPEDTLAGAELTALESCRFEFVLVCHVELAANPRGCARRLTIESSLRGAGAGECLAGLDLDDFTFVSDALALVRLGLADLADTGGEFADRLLVGAGHVD